jgi:hypothetical protein
MTSFLPAFLAIVSANVVIALPAFGAPTRITVVDDKGKKNGQFEEEGGVLFYTDSAGKRDIVGDCSSDVKLRTSNSVNKVAALVVEKNCGATVDFATHVVLKSGNTEQSIAIYAGQPTIKLEWIGSDRLSITRSKLDESAVFLASGEAFGIKISTILAQDSVQSSKYLDFASWNYALMGLTAKLPKEFLLRLAGWTQQASGLHRAKYGNWNGREPYGDDARGHQQILNGFAVYEIRKKKNQGVQGD